MVDYSILDKKQIKYEYKMCKNNEAAETVILVHGIGLDLTIWDEVVPLLLENYNVLRCDLPGHGESAEISGQLTWNLLISAVEELLFSLSITKVHFIGHSGGGNLGIELAFHKKELIETLTLIATPIFIPKELGLQESENRAAKAKAGDIEEVVSPIIQNLCYPATPEKQSKLIKSYKKISVDTYFNYFNLYFEKVVAYTFEDLQKLVVPTMMLVGEQDVLYPPKLQMLNVNYLADLKFYIIPNAANVIMMDQPKNFVQFVNQFIVGSKVTKQVGNSYFYSRALNKELQAIVDSGIQQVDTKKMFNVNMIKNFSVVIDGREVLGKWNQRKARQIMVYLAFHKSVTRDQLVDIFWPEHEVTKAKNLLRVSLNHIKAIIEEHTGEDMSSYMMIGRDTIEIVPEVKMDVSDLIEILEEIEHENDILLKFSYFLEHVSVIPEVLFPSFYEDWVLELRTSIETRIMNICDEILDNKIKDEYAIEALKLLLRFNPTEIEYYDQLLVLLEKENRLNEIDYYKQKRKRQLSEF